MANVVRSVKNGALVIDVQKYADGRYGFDVSLDRYRRKQIRLGDLDSAVEKARVYLSTASGGRVDLLSIDPDEYAEFLAWKARKFKQRAVPDVVAAFIATKERKGRSPHTIRDLRCTLEQFAETFKGAIADLTREEVENWLDGLGVGARRWNNILAAVVALHRFARRDGCLPAEITPIEQIEKRTLEQKPVAIYNAEQLKRYLEVVPFEWRPFIVLGAFCGLRPDEICSDPRGDKPTLEWNNVLFDKRTIDVPASVSKVRRRRFVPMCEAALAWLAPWSGVEGPCCPRKRSGNYSRRWKAVARLPWLSDGWRHSYASHRLAITHDVPALALELGNSVGICMAHYIERVHREDAEKWFAVRP